MPTQQRLRELYDYNPSTGTLVHKRTRGRAVAGASIARPSYKGYCVGRVYHKHYRMHRLVWVYCNGPIPDGMQIDHKNGIRNDNRIENLRLATPAQNSRNRGVTKNNTTGYLGVQWRKDRKRWIARMTVEGTRRIIGSYKTIEEAVARRQKAERELGYFPEHGKRRATAEAVA